MKIGIVGLPFSGKTTFFQTITGAELYSETTHKKEDKIGVVKVPDERLDKLYNIFNVGKKINATIEVVDMAGMQSGDGSSQTFTPNQIGKIKTNDALLFVVRGFHDESVPHIEGSIDMVRDVRTLDDEFMLADMTFIESRLEDVEKEMKSPKQKAAAQKKKEILEKWNDALQNDTPLRDINMGEEETKLAKNYQPLTAKPLLVALNLDEDAVDKSEGITKRISDEITGESVKIAPFFAKIEMELSQLDEEEKDSFMKEYGIEESALNRLIRTAYDLLGLQSFFTIGEDECRAWTIKKGATAQEAAGAVHTDFYDKFIRAEVVSYDEFIKRGSVAKCKEDGVFRLEGKDYIVRDGDIIEIRHG